MKSDIQRDQFIWKSHDNLRMPRQKSDLLDDWRSISDRARGKAAGVDHSSPSRAKVKNAWSYIYIPSICVYL
jgi:hypothetical protein